jgi:hypothetical protein
VKLPPSIVTLTPLCRFSAVGSTVSVKVWVKLIV